MAINLYKPIEAIIITSVVTSSAVYIATLLFPITINRYRAWFSVHLGIAAKQSNQEELSGCAHHCTLCAGCAIRKRPA